MQQIKYIMNNILSLAWVKVVFSAVCVALSWVFDDSRGTAPALIVAVLIVIDSISGIIAAVKSGEGLSSRKSKRIIWKFLIYGIAITTGSACTSKTLEPSHTLIATGLMHEEAHGSLQITTGRFNTDQDIDSVLKAVPEVVTRLRKLSPIYHM